LAPAGVFAGGECLEGALECGGDIVEDIVETGG
jgi:hypothetical protein